MSSIYGTDISEIEDSNIELFKALRAIDADTELNALKDDSTEIVALASVETELTKLAGLETTETILVAGAVAVDGKVSYLDGSSGVYAVTLAVPDASMLGQVKVIEMTDATNDVTLALTNVQGGSAGTTCTWTNVGEALVLVAGLAKWNVVSEGGVVLS